MIANKNIFLFTLLLISNFVLSQKIVADYMVDIKPIYSIYNDTSFSKLKFATEIKAVYNIQQIADDSITFKIKNLAPQVGVSKLKISLKNKNTEITNDSLWDFKYDNSKLIIYTALKTQIEITLTYRYLGSSYVFLPETNFTKFFIFGGTENFNPFTQMFFIPDNYSLINNTIKIYNYTNLLVFTSGKKISSDTKNQYLFKLDSNNPNDFSIFLIDTTYYNKINYKINHKNYNVYVREEYMYERDSIDNIFKKLNSVFTNKESIYSDSVFSIIVIDWKNKTYAMGKTYTNCMIIDKSFLEKNKASFIHEMLHTLLNKEYSPKGNGFYIVNESLIEYLAISILSNNKSEFSKFITKKTYLYNEAKDSISLCNLKINSNNSFNKVYNYGPAIIYNMAREIGLYKFQQLTINFFIEYKGQTTYYNFIKYLKNNNIEKNIINNFTNDICK